MVSAVFVITASDGKVCVYYAVTFATHCHCYSVFLFNKMSDSLIIVVASDGNYQVQCVQLYLSAC